MERLVECYSLKAEVYLHQKDTVQAEKWLDKSLQLNPYDGDAWTTRAYMALARRNGKRLMRHLPRVCISNLTM